MDHFRRAAAAEDRDDDPRSSAFSPPSIIRESSSAFSKPILPTSSSLLSPKPLFGGGANGSSSAAPDPPTPASPGARYRECLRNHAASLGGHVIDGCGEFMPASPADPLKCAACACHRSFHRREPEPEPEPEPDTTYTPTKFGSSSPYRFPLILPPAPHPLMLCGNATDQSSSEERNTNANANTNHHDFNHNDKKPGRRDSGHPAAAGDGARKKRARTKFSPEQKDKMKEFADRTGWRVQKKDEGEMQRFCSEVGVSRQVLKVWMHNNKHLVKKQEDNIKVEGGQDQDQHHQLDGAA